MSEFQEGKVAATFAVGYRVENTKESYEKEAFSLSAMKTAFEMVAHRLETLVTSTKKDLDNGKITVKQCEASITTALKGIEIVKSLYNEAEAKRLATAGAVVALTKVISDVKNLLEEEKEKLKKAREFEASGDFKDRPVGYVSEQSPLDAYKSEPEVIVTEDDTDT
jgi:hypothetical protein